MKPLFANSAVEQRHASVRSSAVRVQRVRRCTYCRLWKDVAEFTKEGDHVVPESMGGAWVDHSVCDTCNGRANENADILIAQDFLIRFLRAMYEIPDRNNTIPKPPVIAVPVSGGVIKVTLTNTGPTFAAGLSGSAIDELALDDQTDQDRLRDLVDTSLGASEGHDTEESLALARRSQPLKTPRTAWSRFMAKIGLACGREAYGEDWLDSRQARTLSADLLGDQPPRFGQRWHYPPVESAWPYEPPKHRFWIEPFENTAILKVALFGQVLGAVPVNDLPAGAYPSAWSSIRAVRLVRGPIEARSRHCTWRVSPAELRTRAGRRSSSLTQSIRSSTSRTGAMARSTLGLNCPAWILWTTQSPSYSVSASGSATPPSTGQERPMPDCVFCGATDKMSAEHVFPDWSQPFLDSDGLLVIPGG